MTNRTLKTALYAAAAVTLAVSVTTASFAQFQRSQPSTTVAFVVAFFDGSELRQTGVFAAIGTRPRLQRDGSVL